MFCLYLLWSNQRLKTDCFANPAQFLTDFQKIDSDRFSKTRKYVVVLQKIKKFYFMNGFNFRLINRTQFWPKQSN